MTLDALTLFGVVALTVMLICYALERRSPWFTFGMAVSCLGAAVYGFLQGAWPFGVLEVIWAVIAFMRWRSDRAARESPMAVRTSSSARGRISVASIRAISWACRCRVWASSRARSPV